MSEIVIGTVDIENFLTVGGKISINFEKQGLFGVVGPNGSGKSAMFVEALEYGLFGVSERYGNERDRIVNRFVGGDCHIHIPMRIGNTKVEVDAYRKHKKYKDEVFLTIDGKDFRARTNPATWERVSKIMDMDHIAFKNSVVFADTFFSSLPDAQRKAIIEKFLGLSWVPKAYELSTQERDKIDGRLDTLSVSHNELKSKIDGLDKDITFYSTKFQDFEKDRGKRIEDLKTSILPVKSTDVDETKISGLENKISLNESFLEDKKVLEDTLKGLDKDEAEISVEIKHSKKDMVEVKEKISKISNTKIEGEVKCGECGQLVTVESKDDFLKHLNSHFIKYSNDFNERMAELEGKNGVRNEVYAQYENILKIEVSNKSLFVLLDRLKNSVSNVKIENARIEERNNGTLKRIEEVERENNAFEDIVRKHKASRDEVFSKLTMVLDEYNKLETEEKYSESLVELYSNKGFKSFVIESVMPDMDKFAYIYSKLFGGKYEINFSPQDKTKRGEVREKFNVQVTNLVGADVYEGNSKGEKQAVDAIIMYVLGDLAASRLNKKVSLLIMDDVFEKLDSLVCEYVIRALRIMSQPKNLREEEFKDLPERESIFVLTHLEQFKNRFENKVFVDRDSKGNTVISSEG